jgi:hypothetical protein
MNQNIKEQTLKNIKIALIMMFITMGLAIVVSTLVFIVVFDVVFSIERR